MNVGRRRDDGCIRHEFTNLFNIQREFSRQQISQRIPRHAKTARRKHLFAILIAGEGSRFSHQRINNMPIIDGRLVLADNARHRLNQMAMMSHRDLLRLTRIPLMISSVSSRWSGSRFRCARSSRNFFRRLSLARLISSSTKATYASRVSKVRLPRNNSA